MTNLDKTLRNSAISVGIQIVVLFLTFLTRKIFCMFLNVELLGYQTLFGNVFSILSVAESGVGCIISANLYKRLVDNDLDAINQIMRLHCKLYKYISVIIFIVGILLIPILPYIVNKSNISRELLINLYLLQLFCTSVEYLFSYKRTLYIADQKEYQCIIIDFVSKFFGLLLQIIAIGLFKNFIAYFTIQLLSSIISNIIISVKSKKDYNFINDKVHIDKEFAKNIYFFDDVKQFLVHRIAFAIYGSTDSIIISHFIGVREVALFGNYGLIFNGVTSLVLYKLLNPVQATIGKIVNTQKPDEERWNQFLTFDLFSIIFATFISSGFLVLYQPTVEIWLGKDYLLSFGFVITLAITAYLNSSFELMYKYRASLKFYENDKYTILLGAIINIIISLALVNKLGLLGIQIGTILGYFIIVFGRIKIVLKIYFNKSILKYLGGHLFLTILSALECALCYIVTQKYEVSILGLLERLVVVILISFGLNYLILRKNKYFVDLVNYLKRTLLSIVTIIQKKGLE